MSDPLIRQGISFGLNQIQPALFSLGPIGVGLGMVFSFVCSFMSDGPSRHFLPTPEPMIVHADTGKVYFAATGEPVEAKADTLGAVATWALQLAQTIGKLVVYFSNNRPDFSTFYVDVDFVQTTNPVLVAVGYEDTPIIRGWLGDTETSYAVNVTAGAYTSTIPLGNKSASFDSNKLFYRVLMIVLRDGNINMDAGIKMILNNATNDKAGIDAAIAQRKIDVADAKKQLAELQAAISELQKQHAKISALQDYDLYLQEQEFLQAQIQMAEIQADTYTAITENNAAVTATEKKPLPAIPLLLIASLFV